mmetsp:Transcript_10820/g.27408  ORF Transcript_10820/g.27408 Transcript_10820/m.27408 type:complete len:518 (+) Transcript_10820:457-2010(+)
MALSRNTRFDCGLLLLVLATTAVGFCHGFSSSQVLSSSAVSVEGRGQVATFAKKIPEFTVDDNDDYSAGKSTRHPYTPPSFTIDDDDDDDGDDYQRNSSNINERSPRTNVKKDSTIKTIRRPRRIQRPKPSDESMVGTSWMDKNAKFSGDDPNVSGEVADSPLSAPRQSSNKFKREIGDTKTFREDFRQTRVFVQGIPPGVSWQDLKDHFREAGNVVFASVSVDASTGQSKGHGIVQFETTAMAQNAIEIMRDFPLNGSSLFVRADVQQNNNPDARLRSSSPPSRGSSQPTKWKCANDENAEYMSEEDMAAIKTLIKERDDARRRRQYDISDRLRDDLKMNFGVFIDDRLKMWWTSIDGKKVPQSIQDVNGDGRWKLQPWRQIPTTPENDACINPDMVEGLLKQRDVARREKDFKTADMLLEQARTSPDGDLELRIHDESRTWRAWTESRPPVGRPYEERRASMPSDPVEAKKTAARECVIIIKEHAPEKLEEIVTVLKRFPGREFQVLKRLKQQYL